jgi:hypothetical protein
MVFLALCLLSGSSKAMSARCGCVAWRKTDRGVVDSRSCSSWYLCKAHSGSSVVVSQERDLRHRAVHGCHMGDTYLLTYMARENRAPTVGANRLMG